MSKSVTFGERLRSARLACKYSQQFVAHHLDITRPAYGYYESEIREMRHSDIIKVCKLFNISADYLLGLSPTKNPEYAKVAETTGLNQSSITRLKQRLNSESEMIDHLLAEELFINTWVDPQYEAYQNSPEYIEQAYQDHLQSLAWEEEMQRTHILQHLANDWARNSHESSLTTEERIAREEEYAKNDIPGTDYESVDPDAFGPLSQTAEEAAEQEASALRFEAQEAKKSKLLSAITDYVRNTSRYALQTNSWQEDLTEQHALRICTNNGHSITFPSKEADELVEFMLLQKVIEALKAFKQNCFSDSNR